MNTQASSADSTLATQVSRIVINAPIQQVWDALIMEGEVLPFFFGTVMHTTTLAPGAPIRMRTPNGKYTGVVGEVLELEPPRLYSMTFKFTNFDDAVCKICHELKEVEGGTEYTLTSTEIPRGTKTEKQLAQGGKFIVGAVKHYVETGGKANMMGKFIMLMSALTGFMTPKQCLTENWPLDEKIT